MSDATCPRCGYDLSGTVSTWETACPLEGVCSECGLELEWRDVLDSKLVGPAWSFEHWRRASGATDLVRRALATWWKAVRPWAMWRAMGLHHPVHPLRIAWITILGCAMTYIAVSFVAVGVKTGVYHLIRDRIGIGTSLWSEPWHMAVWPMVNCDGFGMIPARVIFVLAGMLTFWLVLMGACFVVLGESLRRAKVRARHIVRITAYSLASLPVYLFLFLMSDDVDTLGGAFQNRSFTAPAASVAMIGLLLLMPMWLLVTWWCALRLYVRLRHAFWTALLLTFMSGLATFVLILLIGLAVNAD